MGGGGRVTTQIGLIIGPNMLVTVTDQGTHHKPLNTFFGICQTKTRNVPLDARQAVSCHVPTAQRKPTCYRRSQNKGLLESAASQIPLSFELSEPPSSAWLPNQSKFIASLYLNVPM
jgi:hypothetical protein